MTDKPLAPGIIKRMERDGVQRTIDELNAEAARIFALLEGRDRLKVIEGGKK